MTGKLSGRIALITGASRGIGAAVAKKYAEEGAHVILTARTVDGLEKVDDYISQNTPGKATLVPLDLKETDKINQLAATIAEKYKRIDILVGNAGVLGDLRPLHHITEKIWKDVMDINLNANWHLIRAFDPLLRESEAGRVIFVTSGVTENVFPYWGPYTISKAALESMANIYAAEVETTNIKVNLIDPGVVRTHMRAKAMPGENAESITPPEEVTEKFVELASEKLTISGSREAA